MTTLRPARAAQIAAAKPVGPPPQMQISVRVSEFTGISADRGSSCIGIQCDTAETPGQGYTATQVGISGIPAAPAGLMVFTTGLAKIDGGVA
jgi:hypothetical protein